jgi:parallel beta-helix repeat protein
MSSIPANNREPAMIGLGTWPNTADPLRWLGICLMAVLFVILNSSFGRSADYWVAPHGSDREGRGDQRRPWATLQFAADRVRPGDTVHVLDGDYTGFYLDRSGNRRTPIRFIAEGRSVRIIRRNRETPDGINIEGAGYVVVDGFAIAAMPRAGIRATHSAGSTIRRIRADRNRGWGIYTSFCDDILILDNIASGSIAEHGIYVSNSGDRPIVRGNVCRENRQCGIHLNGGLSNGGDGIISGAVIENNLVFGNGRGGGSGINGDGLQDSTIRNNLLYENHSSGISLYCIDGGAGSRSNRVVNNTILMAETARWAINIKNQSTNNVVWNNILLSNNRSRGSINIATDSVVGFRSDYNIVADRLSPDDGERILSLRSWTAGTNLDRHSLVATPQEVFVNASAGDYHLRAGSPAIDTADPSASPPQDLEGRQRPAGSRSDIGAFESGR